MFHTRRTGRPGARDVRPWMVFLLSAVFAGLPSAAGHATGIPDLQEAAEIVRDSKGIPHIYAQNEHDLFFLMGWVHAEDRLFQMDVSRRQASGTLAELLGTRALPGDVELRFLGMHRAAERTLPLLSDPVRAVLEAYSAGVNAFVESHPLPPEYATLELTRVKPWSPLDSIMVSKLILGNLSIGFDSGATLALRQYEQAGVAGGFDGTALYFEDIFRSAPFDPASTLPDASSAPEGDGGDGGAGAVVKPVGGKLKAAAWGVQPATVALAQSYLDRVRDIPLFRGIIDVRDQTLGSNHWAVSGAHTESGFPMLASDPHQPLSSPAIFHQIHLVADSLDVTGSCFAGMPFVALGHNRSIAWGATANPVDVMDMYEEQVVEDGTSPSGLSTVYRGEMEHIVALPVEFRFNRIGNLVMDNVVTATPSSSIPPVLLIVPRRNQGPLVDLSLASGVGLSVQFTGFSGTRELDALYLWNHADGLEDFEEGLKLADTGYFNWAYADVEGNIAYFTSGEIPLREDLEAGSVEGLPPFFIRNGTGGNEWVPAQDKPDDQAVPYAILPQEEMPHVINPPAGYFVNANNDPTGTSLDNDPLNHFRDTGGIYYLRRYYAPGFRAGRITQMLRDRLGTGKVSLEDMKAMQADTVLRDAQFFVPWILTARDNAGEEDAPPALAALADDPAVAEAIGRLAAWDFSTPTGIEEGYDAADEDGVLSTPDEAEISASVAATIYAVWRRWILENTIDTRLGAIGVGGPGHIQAVIALRHLFESFAENRGVGASGLDFFVVPGVDDPDARRDILVLRSLSQALSDLAGPAYSAAFGRSTDQDDYRWGRLHRIVFAHLLGGQYSTPSAFGTFPRPIPGLSGIPADGGLGTVDPGYHWARAKGSNDYMTFAGASRRFVAEAPTGGIRAESSLPGGESADPESPFYQSLLRSWLTNETHPLLSAREDIAADATVVSSFTPAPRFLRGDCNDDGVVDISDAVFSLGSLFLGEGEPGCEDACDSNDDGELDISDAISSLGVLFLGSGVIPLPGMTECGVDPTDDEIGCADYTGCP